MAGTKEESKSKKRKHKKHLEQESDESSSGEDRSSSKAEKKSSKHKKHKKKHRKHGSESDSPDERPKSKSKSSLADDALLQEAKSFLQAALAQGGANKTSNAPASSATNGSSSAALPPPPMGASAVNNSNRGGSNYGPQLPHAFPGPAPPPHTGSSSAPARTGPPLTPADYFVKNSEFSNWLKEERHLELTAIDSQTAHALFDGDFMQAWNTSRLDAKYYAGGIGRRSSHAWGIKGGAAGGGGGIGDSVGMGGMRGFLADEEQRRMDSSQQHRVEQKAWRKEQKEEREEMAPKATGREAKVEARFNRREAAREGSPDGGGAFLPGGGGGGLMGGDDSFAAAKAREERQTTTKRNFSTARQEETNAKVAAYQAKEDALMAGFKALAARGPISIPKRQ